MTKIVALGHVAHSGKDSAAQILLEAGWTPLKFAAPVYDMVYRTDRTIRGVVDRYGWEAAKRGDRYTRHALEDMGAAMRAVHGPHVLIDHLLDRLHALPAGSKVAITDLRYPAEVEELSGLGAVLVRVVRPGVLPAGPSDRVLHGFTDWDLSLTNDSDIPTLQARLHAGLEGLGVAV